MGKNEEVQGYIRCPHCGKVYVVPEEDLSDEDVSYHCNNCGQTFDVALFGYCEKCQDIVGLEHGSMREILTDVALKSIGGFLKPWSTLKVLPRFLDDVPSSDNWGKCPFCNKEYIRCPQCHSLVEFYPGTDDEAILRCPKCGQRMRHS